MPAPRVIASQMISSQMPKMAGIASPSSVRAARSAGARADRTVTQRQASSHAAASSR